jgi:hypothetical protein
MSDRAIPLPQTGHGRTSGIASFLNAMSTNQRRISYAVLLLTLCLSTWAVAGGGLPPHCETPAALRASFHSVVSPNLRIHFSR